MHGLLKGSVRILRKIRKEARKDEPRSYMQGLLGQFGNKEKIQENKLNFFSLPQMHSASFGYP